LPKSRVEFESVVPLSEWKNFLRLAAEEISQEIKIAGFRPGKAPRNLVEQKVGKATVFNNAAEKAVSKNYLEYIKKEKIEAIGNPEIKVLNAEEEKDFCYKAVVSVMPEIVLDEGYVKSIKKINEEFAKKIVEVGKEEVDLELEKLAKSRVKLITVRREARKNDSVEIDFNVFMDGVPIENGQSQKHPLIIGKGVFIPGFEDKIVGMKEGEEKEFELDFPSDYHQKNLAGKMVDFKVEVKEVYSRTIPKLDDTLAAFFQMKDLADLKKNLQESMLNEKSRSLNLKNESEMIGKIVEDTKFGDLPENLITSETKNVLAELEQNVTRQGGKFEDYLQHLKKTKDQLMLELTPNAIKRVKSALVIREIAVLEKINPSDDEVKQKVEELKKQYVGREEILKMFDEPGYFSYLANILTNEQVIAKLKEWNYAPTGAQQKS